MQTKSGRAKGFSDEEREAMRERARELNSENGEAAVLAKINDLPEPDRALAKRLHQIIKKNAPTLTPKTWYGMPAYANKEGKVVCFLQSAAKFKTRYATIGFSDQAKLDDGSMWPNGYALMKLTAEAESKIAALVKKAVG